MSSLLLNESCCPCNIRNICIALVFDSLYIWEYLFTLRPCSLHVVYYLLLVCRKLQILQNLRYCCCLWIVFDIYFFSFAFYSCLLAYLCFCLSFTMCGWDLLRVFSSV